MVGYIGKSPTVGNFVKLDSITTSATTTFNLLNDGVAYSPENARVCQVSLNGVIQNPETAFNIVGSTIVFSQALTSDDVIDYILVLGDVMSVGTPSDATVSTAKIVDSAVTTAKVNDSAITTAKINNDAVTEAKLNLISTSSVPSIEAKGDGTTDGYIQLNCSQNSHGIKIKSAPHSANASYTLTLPNNDGNANQVLTTDGSGNLSFADAGGGAFEKLVTTNITSGAVTNVTFDSTYITSTYRDYRIICSNFEVSADSYLYMRISDDNGSNFKSANNYKYASRSYKSDSTTNSQGSNGTGEFRITADTMKDGGSPSDRNHSIIIDIHDPLNTNTYFTASWRGMFISASSLACGLYGGGYYNGNASSSFNAIQLFLNSGNLELGSYTLYGRKI